MKVFDTGNIRNIAFVGGPKTGKTTLLECMLFESGAINRRGTVEEGNTVSDFTEIEHERGNSIFAALASVVWRENKLNIIDTPGNDNFVGEIYAGLRVSDTHVMLLNAQNGFDIGSQIVYRHVATYEKPIVVAINNLDNENANFDQTLEQVRRKMGSGVTVIQYPYNAGTGFNSIIDVLKMVLYKFPAGGGKPEKLEIPSEERPKAEALHNALVEASAENDEELMNLYFEKGELSEEEMRKGMRKGVHAGDIIPVFCLCAKHNMGSGRLMGFLNDISPSPAEASPEKDSEGRNVPADSSASPSLFIWKITIEPHLGTVSYFKVTSGILKTGMDLIDSRSLNSERFGAFSIVEGKKKTPVDELRAGDLGSAVKLKDVATNNSLYQKGKEIIIAKTVYPGPRISEAVAAANQKDEEKLAEVLMTMKKEDPTLLADYSAVARQMIIQGQGELHLQLVKWRMEGEHKIKIEFSRPRISYRETIQGTAIASYRHKKQSGGSGQFGEVHLQVDPWFDGMEDPDQYNVRNTEEIELKWGGKLVFLNCIVGGAIDQRYIPAVQKGIMKMMEEGPLTGSYVRDVRVALFDGKMHAVDSNDISFQIAGSFAFKDAFKNAKPKLLEPIYDVEIICPEDATGEIMTDLQSRRAIPQGIDSEGSFQKVIAKVPLAELYRYSTSLRSISQGRAFHTQKFASYEIVPEELKQKLISDFQKAEEVVA